MSDLQPKHGSVWRDASEGGRARSVLVIGPTTTRVPRVIRANDNVRWEPAVLIVGLTSTNGLVRNRTTVRLDTFHRRFRKEFDTRVEWWAATQALASVAPDATKEAP